MRKWLIGTLVGVNIIVIVTFAYFLVQRFDTIDTFETRKDIVNNHVFYELTHAHTGNVTYDTHTTIEDLETFLGQHYEYLAQLEDYVTDDTRTQAKSLGVEDGTFLEFVDVHNETFECTTRLEVPLTLDTCLSEYQILVVNSNTNFNERSDAVIEQLQDRLTLSLRLLNGIEGIDEIHTVYLAYYQYYNELATLHPHIGDYSMDHMIERIEADVLQNGLYQHERQNPLMNQLIRFYNLKEN